jgi:predicted PurR-regulated permease PerM
MTRQQLFVFGFLAILLVLLYPLAEVFSPFLRPLLWAAILAHFVFPLHTRLTGLLRGWAVASAALLTVGIIALIVAPLVFFTFMLVQEAGNGYDAVNTWVQSGGVKRLPDELAKLPLLGGSRAQHVIHKLVGSPANIEAFLLQSAKAMSGFIVEQLTGLVKNAFLLAINFLVIVITLFFFFKDGKRLLQSLYRAIPLDKAHKDRMFSRLDQTITAVVKGIVITAIAQGLLAGLAYVVLDVPFPAFLMALTIVLAPLPFGGTALVWGPVVLYLLWTGPAWKAIAMLAWGVGVVMMVDNVLKPMLIGKGAKLPVLFLFLSILGGLAAYGLIGLFLGPILLAVLLTAFQIFHEEYLTESTPPPPMTA